MIFLAYKAETITFISIKFNNFYMNANYANFVESFEKCVAPVSIPQNASFK